MPFCSNCGKKLAENEICNCQTNPAQSPQNINVVVPPKKDKSWIIILIVVVLFLFIFVGGILAAILVPAMLGYVKKSHIAAANSSAKSVALAATSAFNDMDISGTNIKGTYILCSDKEDNVFIYPDDIAESERLDEGKFYNSFSEYYTDRNIEWFVVMENGIPTYCIAQDSENEVIGSYPKISDTKTGTPYYLSTATSDDAEFDEFYTRAYQNVH